MDRDFEDSIPEKDIELIKLRQDNKRLREALERLLREITHAHFNPNWFTGGKSNADRHITTELRRAKQALEENV